MADDSTLPFYDISWLAVPAVDPADLLAILDLSDSVPVTWRQGLAAVCGDFWDFEANLDAPLTRVFLTPPIDGWRLVVGGWFGGAEGDEHLEAVARSCQELSRRYGQAHAFTTQGRMDFYAWILARAGELLRHFVWDGRILVSVGMPSPAEQRSRRAAAATSGEPEVWSPSEELVMAIAGEWSIDPSRLGAPADSAGRGLLATTAWGRQHGVPARPLE